jgi:hypothetical protein
VSANLILKNYHNDVPGLKKPVAAKGFKFCNSNNNSNKLGARGSVAG